MKLTARLLAFLFLFCVDVRVHAGQELSEQPFVAKHLQILQVAGSKLVLARGGLIQREGDTVRLVRGSMYFDGETSVKIRTPFATLRCLNDCRVLLERENETVTVKNLLGQVSIRRAGEAQDYLLPTATQVRIGPVTSQGFAEMEFPQSLPWSETAREWAKLFPGSLVDFKNELETFRPIWREAVEAVSYLHSERAGREIASADRAARAAADRAAETEIENAKLRRLFRQKNHVYE